MHHQTATEVHGTKMHLRTLVIDQKIVPEKRSDPPYSRVETRA